jgi:hypothetical protein
MPHLDQKLFNLPSSFLNIIKPQDSSLLFSGLEFCPVINTKGNGGLFLLWFLFPEVKVRLASFRGTTFVDERFVESPIPNRSSGHHQNRIHDAREVSK